MWERKLIRGKKLQKSKSLIKTVLFAAELCITWLLLVFSFSVFLFSLACHTLLCYMIHNIRSHAIRFSNEFLLHTIELVLSVHSLCLPSAVTAVAAAATAKLVSMGHVFLRLTSAKIYSLRKTEKFFTNKQQIKIWQKCVQIIMEYGSKKNEASYETNAAKNKEINILSVKKGRPTPKSVWQICLQTQYVRENRPRRKNTRKKRKIKRRREEVKWNERKNFSA